MVGRTLDWKGELGRWLKPFLDRLGHKARRDRSPPEPAPASFVPSIFGRDTRSIQPGPIAIAAGVRLGCVLANAGYRLSAPFRQGLTARKLIWAVGIPRHLKVYPADVRMIGPVAKRGRLNPQDCFEHTTRWSRFAPRTSIGNSVLRKIIPDAFPLLVRELNHSTFISDRQQAAILR
jgi:DDE superfamily endonuclease